VASPPEERLLPDDGGDAEPSRPAPLVWRCQGRGGRGSARPGGPSGLGFSGGASAEHEDGGRGERGGSSRAGRSGGKALLVVSGWGLGKGSQRS